MKTRIFFFLVMIAATGKVSGQDYKIINGDTINLCNDFIHSEVFAQDSSGFYIIEHYAKACGRYLTKISSKDARVMYRVDLPELESGENTSLIKKELVDTRILLFYTVLVKREKSLLLLEVDAKTGKTSGDYKLIDKISHDYDSFGSYGSLGFYVVFSPDKSKMAFFSEIKKIKEDSRELKEFHATAKLFSTKQFVKLWEKPLISSYGNSLISIRDYVLTNDGLFYYLFDFLRDQKHYFKRQGISMTGENPKRDKVYELDNKADTRTLLKGCTALNLTANKIFCTGFFVDGEQTQFLSSKTACGFFLVVIDPKTFSVLKQDFSYTKGYVETTNPDILTDFTAGPILEDGKGGYYCIKLKPSSSTWQYAQVGICKYTKDFDLEWMKVIPKYSYSASAYSGVRTFKDEPLLGFSFQQYDGGLRFFYPDHKKNLSKFPDISKAKVDNYTMVTSLKNAVFVCTTVSSKGELSREALSTSNQSVFFGEVGEEEHLWVKKTGAILVKNYITEFKKSYSLFTYSKP